MQKPDFYALSQHSIWSPKDWSDAWALMERTVEPEFHEQFWASVVKMCGVNPLRIAISLQQLINVEHRRT